MKRVSGGANILPIGKRLVAMVLEILSGFEVKLVLEMIVKLRIN